jgi:hypothetical protein
VAAVINARQWYDLGLVETRILAVTTGPTNPVKYPNYTNLFVGWDAAGPDTNTQNNGSHNTFTGRAAGFSQNSANATDNTYNGYEAGWSNDVGFQNTFVGGEAGFANTTTGGVPAGSQNAFFGYRAGFHNLTGIQNSCFGTASCFRNMTGNHNTIVGFDAAFGVLGLSMNNNTFMGFESGFVNQADNNSFYGYMSGFSNTTGAQNTFVGYKAGFANTTGGQTPPIQGNTFLGYGAGTANVSGAGNTFLGNLAGSTNVTGGGNTSIGDRAGLNADGCCSTFVGSGAGLTTTVGGNQFFGYRAGGFTTTGFANTFTGYVTGLNNTTGTYNAFYGVNTALTNTTGSKNTFFGTAAGSVSNVTGDSNIYIGFNAGNSAGANNSNNIYVGNLGANESGAIRIGVQGTQVNRTFIAGIYAYPGPWTSTPLPVVVDSSGHLGVSLAGLPTGNCALGPNFLTKWTSTTGVDCSHVYERPKNNTLLDWFVGINLSPVLTNPQAALDVNGGTCTNGNTNGCQSTDVNSGINTTVTRNSFMIEHSPVLTAFYDNNTSINRNLIVGFNGAHATNVGQQNTLIGSNAGNNMISGSSNTIVGSAAGFANNTGYSNTCVGQVSCRDNIDGHDNTAVGEFADTINPHGSYNIAIGSGSGQNNVSGNNNIYVANVGATESNIIRIGTVSGLNSHTAAYVAGIYTSTPTPAAWFVCVDSNGKLGAQPAPCSGSSRRFKEQIRQMDDGTSGLLKLRPVTFFYKPEYDNGPRTLQYGLIAEEVAKVYPEMVAYDNDGQPYAVKYQMLPPMLLNEFQKQYHRSEAQDKLIAEQHEEIQALRHQSQVQQTQIEGLTQQLQLQNAAFQERLSRLESALSSQIKVAADKSSQPTTPGNGGLQ